MVIFHGYVKYTEGTPTLGNLHIYIFFNQRHGAVQVEATSAAAFRVSTSKKTHIYTHMVIGQNPGTIWYPKIAG